MRRLTQSYTLTYSRLDLSLYLVYNCIAPLKFLPWEIGVAIPGESQLGQSRATRPTLHAGSFSVSIIHRTTGSLTCAHMLMHAIAHEGVRTPKESLHWKLTRGGKNPLPQLGNRTCVSGVTVRCSNQLSYIPSTEDRSLGWFLSLDLATVQRTGPLIT